MAERVLFTSESVSMGHPDKMADQISDAVLDAMLAADPRSRVACETMTSTGFIVVAGEVTTRAVVDVQDVVRRVVREIGYDDSRIGFDGGTCAVLVALGKQSPDIAQGVDEDASSGKEQGAGDQGLMFGFACDESEAWFPGTYMPLPIMLAHRLIENLTDLRRKGAADWLRPDAKSQVTVEYDGDRPVRVDAVVISTQHAESADVAKVVRPWIIERLIRTTIPKELLDDRTVFHVNPTGRFVTGGPMGDCGLTGRKIIVDTYGGMGRHGGGAFSGKDPSKVDRSAAYAARWVAKNIVAAGLARRAEVQLSYAIGVAEPLSVRVMTFGTNAIPERRIEEIVKTGFDLRPRGIIEALDLLRPIYRATSYHGHFGRNLPEFTWERTDRVEELRRAAAASPGTATGARR